jgi:diguanylate cyclase (GGDEF)-like protein
VIQIEALATARDLAAASRGKLIDWVDHRWTGESLRDLGMAQPGVVGESIDRGRPRHASSAGEPPCPLAADGAHEQAPAAKPPQTESSAFRDYLFTVDADDLIQAIVPGASAPFPLPARDTASARGVGPDFASAFWRAVRHARGSGEPCCVDFTDCGDGVERWYQVWLAPAHARELIGVVCDITAGTRTAFAQSAREETYLRVIADLRAETHKLQAERDKLLELATSDYLTGVWNRQAIFVLLEKALASARRASRPVTIIMADIDKFKGINDRLGHPAGDEVLREVARRFHSCVRLSDEVGRYGGEEFLFLLPGCSEPAALSRAEQFRLAIDCAPFLVDGRPLHVTCSFGLYTVRGGSADADADADADEAVYRADAALYSAKNLGRNCCVSLHE